MYRPLQFILFYNVAAVLMAHYGPIYYPDLDFYLVASYISLILAAITVGYMHGIRVQEALPQAPVARTDFFPRRLFLVFLVLALIGFAVNLATQIASGSANFDLNSLGDTYISAYEGYELNSGNYKLSFILYTLFLAPTFFTTIWGLFYFKFLPHLLKLATVAITLLFPLIFTLISGTQKNIGDLMIYLFSVILARQVTFERKISPIAVVVVAVIGVVGVFALSQILAQRAASVGIDLFNINRRETYQVVYDSTHVVFRLFGPDLGLPLSTLTGYLTNGLNGLSYSLKLPSTWSHFLGTSYSVSVIANRVFGIPFPYHDTYPHMAGLINGWGENRWHSVFSWFASDFTFAGTVPIFGWLGYVYARCWRETITFANPFSVALFCLLSLGVVMMPANNQLMQSPGAMLTLVTTCFLYLRFRRRFNQPVAPPTQAQKVQQGPE